MIYTIPDYYQEFRCLASDCPATCCAGWQIVIDDKTLRRYRNLKGSFGSRLANAINWKQQTFEQYEGRCAFLNEQNLCDIHLEAGADLMCRTCRNYPRHTEVYENERELSLSLSCPAIARLLLGRKERVTFRSIERGGVEQEEEFDDLLYSALQDCRELLLAFAQNRADALELRMAKLLALAHDVQNRIQARRLFEVEGVLERYRRPGADARLTERLRRYVAEQSERLSNRERLDELVTLRWRQLDYLRDFEVLDPLWREDLQAWRRLLYGRGCAGYLEAAWQFREAEKEWETEYEQILVYFLFTYFCGAVYDGDCLKKVQMSVTSVLILRELALAEWIRQDGRLSFEDRAKLAWRYSRELEHSDPNLFAMERMMGEWKEAGFESLLTLLLEA